MVEIDAILEDREAAEQEIIEAEKRHQRALLQKAKELRATMAQTLLIEPVGCRDRPLALWKINKPLTLEMAEHFFEVAGVEQPILDFRQLVIKEWQEGKYDCIGTVLIETEQLHGLVKRVQRNGWICEESYYNGVQMGISRTLWHSGDNSRLSFFKDGEEVAWLHYSVDFE